MFKLTKKNKDCLLKIGIGGIIILFLFRLFKNVEGFDLNKAKKKYCEDLKKEWDAANRLVGVTGGWHEKVERGYRAAELKKIEASKKREDAITQDDALKATLRKWANKLEQMKLKKVEAKNQADEAKKRVEKVCDQLQLSLSRDSGENLEFKGRYCPYEGEKWSPNTREGQFWYPPPDKQEQGFSIQQCSKECSSRGMSWMSHGRDTRNTNAACDVNDSDCKGRCYCYKSCNESKLGSSTAYNTFSIKNENAGGSFILKAESSHWGNEGPKYLSWSGGQRSLPNGKKYAIWDPRKSEALRLKLTSEGVLYTAEEIGGHVRYLNMYFDAADGHHGWLRYATASTADGAHRHNNEHQPVRDGPLIFPVWESVNKGGITTFTGGKMKFTKNNKTYDIESVYPYLYLDKLGNSLGGAYTRLSHNRDYGELTTKGSRLTITKVVP